MKRTRLVLCLWLLGMFLPLAILSRLRPANQVFFDAIFDPEWVHILMHTALFAGLIILLLFALRLPMTHRTTIIVILVVLSVGSAQEGVQLLCRGQLPTLGVLLPPAIFDLGVDLVGGMLGLGIIYMLKPRLRDPKF